MWKEVARARADFDVLTAFGVSDAAGVELLRGFERMAELRGDTEWGDEVAAAKHLDRKRYRQRKETESSRSLPVDVLGPVQARRVRV